MQHMFAFLLALPGVYCSDQLVETPLNTFSLCLCSHHLRPTLAHGPHFEQHYSWLKIAFQSASQCSLQGQQHLLENAGGRERAGPGTCLEQRFSGSLHKVQPPLGPATGARVTLHGTKGWAYL